MRDCSYSRRRPSWLVYSSTVSRPLAAVSAPTVFMKLRLSVMLLTMVSYLALIPSSLTWPSSQSRGECKSAIPELSEARM